MTTYLTRLLASLFFMSVVFRAAAGDKTETWIIDGKPVLTLQVPALAKATFSNDHAVFHTSNMSLHLWIVPDAKTAADAVPRVAEVIKSEFVNFKTTFTEDMVIAGAPARHLIGSGNEADDGDPGHAEVVFFVVGGHVLAACVHGEFDDASRARAPMMAILQTAHAPP